MAHYIALIKGCAPIGAVLGDICDLFAAFEDMRRCLGTLLCGVLGAVKAVIFPTKTCVDESFWPLSSWFKMLHTRLWYSWQFTLFMICFHSFISNIRRGFTYSCLEAKLYFITKHSQGFLLFNGSSTEEKEWLHAFLLWATTLLRITTWNTPRTKELFLLHFAGTLQPYFGSLGEFTEVNSALLI